MKTLIETDDYQITIEPMKELDADGCLDELALEVTIKSAEKERLFLRWLEEMDKFKFKTFLNGNIVSYDFFEHSNPDNCFLKVINFFLKIKH